MSEGPFRKRTAYRLSGVVLLSLAVFVFATAYGVGRGEVRSVGPDALSRSAIGYRAFVTLLRELGIPVTVSRYASGFRAGEEAVLVLLEPRLSLPGGEEALREMLEQAATVLLVLPKWRFAPDGEDPDRVGAVWEREPRRVRRVLAAAGLEARPVRIAAEDAVWEPGRLGPVVPELPFPQLLSSAGLEPVVSAGGRILIGEAVRGRSRIMVIADPDLLSNHGLRRGGNALLAVRALEELGAGERPVIVDATLSGHTAPPSVGRELFRFPLVLAVAQAVLLLGLAAWAAAGRFGAPLPEEPPLAPGKRVLIENTSKLLLFGAPSSEALRRHLEAAVAEAGRVLHAPPDLRGPALTAWLDELGRRRGVGVALADLEREVAGIRGARGRGASRIVAAAQSIHDWKEEILHGSGRHPGRDRAD